MLELRPRNVARVMLREQDIPLRAGFSKTAADDFAPGFDLHRTASAAVGVGPGVDRVGQYFKHRAVAWRLPDDGPLIVLMLHARQIDSLLQKPQVYLTHGVELFELAKDQPDGLANAGIGIDLDAISIRRAQIADRYRREQLLALGLFREPRNT